MSQTDELLSLAEVCRLLGGITAQTVRRMIRRGDLAAYRVGLKKFLVRRSDLEDYLNRCRVIRYPLMEDATDA